MIFRRLKMSGKKEQKIQATIFKKNFFIILSFFLFSLFLLIPAGTIHAQDQLCIIHQNSSRGPQLGCAYCHDDPYPGYLNDSLNLQETGVCNSCHSPEGQYNGVDDAIIGAKSNWTSGGVYEGNVLKSGKRKWCVGCHDDGSCEIQGASAANIAGLTISGGDWQSPASIVSGVSDAENLLDNDLESGCSAGEIIFDLGDSTTISHIRLHVANASIFWNVYGGNDLSSWTRILFGQGLLHTGPRWATSASQLGQWNESRLDRYIPFRYIRLVNSSTWPVGTSVLKEFEFKKDLQYGYYDTGHKMSCTQCHDIQKIHIDADPRTYNHLSDPYNDLDLNNYQNGYRLKKIEIDGAFYPPMEIPRTGCNWGESPRTDNDFALCFTCHDKNSLLGDAYSSPGLYPIVDNTDAATTGTWGESSSTPGYYGTNYLYSPGVTGEPTATCTWTPDLPSAGAYKVYARWTSWTNRATNAQYIIRHSGTDFITPQDQTQKGGTWVLLGSFDFDGNGEEYVTLTNVADNIVIADAVRFEELVPIVDNTDAEITGTWGASSSTAGYYGTNYLYSQGVTGEPTATCTWTPDQLTPGTYTVYARWTSWGNRATNAQYSIHHSGLDTVAPPQNQTINGGIWVSLGSFDFDGSGEEYVTLTNVADNIVIADAIKIGEFDTVLLQTNFRNDRHIDAMGNVTNEHLRHLRGRFYCGNAQDWDSDWDGISDSPQSCTGCHNVHGSSSPVMIRHGELISSVDKNKSPSLNLYHRNEFGKVDEKVSVLESIGGITQFWGPGPGIPNKNGICNMCHNDKITYLRDAVEAVSCVACHARPFDTTRQITGENGDFVLPSHHVTDETSNQIVTDQDCRACHDQTHHTEGNVWLRDADGGDSYSYDPADQYTAEAACLSCHDSNIEAPFSDGIIVPDIEKGNFWNDSAHATGGSIQIGLTCMGEGVLTGCHDNAHGSEKPSLLAPSQTSEPEEEGFCYMCHDGQLVGKDIQAPFQKAYRHPIERSDIHQTDENGLNLDPTNRHAECLDCHNPHAAGANIHTPTGNQIAADSVLKGTWGVEPIVAPDTLPGQQIYQFIELKAPNYPEGSTKEYQICFKCHSYYALGWADHGVTDIIGPSGEMITDQAMEFSPANLSAHPVVMETSAQPGAYEPKGLDPVQLKDPWKTNAGNQTMYCSDCHGTDTVDSADAQGPHGSDKKFMLKDPTGGTRTYWPEKPDGELWTLFDLRADINDWQNKLFCAICHPFFEDAAGPTFLNTAHQRGSHHSQYYTINGQGYWGTPCVVCHTAVPHGSAVSRLIAYRNDVAPYNYGGNMATITEFQKAGRYSYSKWNCSIPDELWGCHTRGFITPKNNWRIIYDPDGDNPPHEQNTPPEVVSLNEDKTLEVSEIEIFSGADCYDPDGSIFQYQWNFGDGMTASGLLATHSYQTPGPHMVTLTVTDNKGAQTTDMIAAITVNRPNQQPVAEAGPDQTVLISQEVFFSGAGSYDPDGTIAHYRWDFGDGIIAEGPEAAHIFDDFECTYQVLLTVTDNNGAHHTDMTTITINLP